MRELPIACSLTAGDLEARRREVRSVGEAALTRSELGPQCAVLSFAHTPEIAPRLRKIVDAEAECCPFLAMSLHEEAERITLTIEAPAGAEIVLKELVGLFAGVSA